MKYILTVCVVFLVCCTALSLCALYSLKGEPVEMNLDQAMRGPETAHIFGTDWKGRDIFVMTAAAAPTSIGIAALCVTVSASLGFIAACSIVFFGGFTGRIISTLVDICLSFPELLLAIAVASVMRPSALTILISISAYGWAGFTRLCRSEILKIYEQGYTTASLSLGSGRLRTALVHVLRNCLSLLITVGSMKMGAYILAEAALSFLGFGIAPPSPSLGRMIYENMPYLWTGWWMVFFPGLFIVLTVMSFNIIGIYLNKKLI